MKIAFLCDSIFNIGGVQRVVTSISNLLCEAYSIDIICTDTNYNIDYDKYGLNGKKINVIFKPKPKNYLILFVNKLFKEINKKFGILDNDNCIEFLKKVYYPDFLSNEFVNFFNIHNYDVVIGCEGYYSLFLSVISDKINSKTVGWMHNSYAAYFKNDKLYYWRMEKIFKKYLKKLDKVIVLTHKDKEQFDVNFSINSKTIYNPISFTSEIKSTLKSKNIIAVGRLVLQKGFDNLIEAFSLISGQIPDWRLIIVGDGKERESLIQIIDKHELSKSIFIEEFTNNIQERYLNSSIYVMSSRWEGFGLVVTEAMEMGLPVVSFKVSGPAEILGDFECGYLVERNDINDFANKILELALNYEKREELGKNSIKRARDFHGKNIMTEWVSCLEGLCEDIDI